MGFFPTYMALLGPTRLFIFGKSSHIHCFCVINIKKFPPTYTPLKDLHVIRAPSEMMKRNRTLREVGVSKVTLKKSHKLILLIMPVFVKSIKTKQYYLLFRVEFYYESVFLAFYLYILKFRISMTLVVEYQF